MDFRPFFSSINDLNVDSFLEQDSGDVLPDLEPLFSIPALPEKPHNPILDSLNGSGIHPSPPPSRIRTELLPPELAILTEPTADPALDHPFGLWHSALLPENQALFWDRMCPGIRWDKPSSTPFISEQDDLVYSTARQLQEPPRAEIDRIYISKPEFLSALRNTVLGTSSIYHVWNSKQERFVHINVAGGRQSCLIVDGKDEIICQSVVQRFLTIGTLLRRLETLLDTLRARSAQDGPTIHAFSHSMSTILAYLRDEISGCSTDLTVSNQHLTATWAQYTVYEDILVALSSFYGCSEHVSPEDYPLLESTPIPLLNSIYKELELHIQRHSTRIVTSIFAFMLTNTCQDYLREISNTVGYGVVYVKKSSRVVGELADQYGTDETKEEEEHNDIFEAIQQLGTEFPSFFPPELLNVLPAAQKSLILLQEAQPEHPLLVSPEGQEPVNWFWTEDEINAAWNKAVGKQSPHELGSQPTVEEVETSILYKPEIAEFRIFDQEPGCYDGPSTLKSENIALTAFRTFVDNFPDALPPITPTLPLLASLIFSKLVDHASKLSNTLLSVFLSSAGNLNLRAHLELLRSFVLVTSPAFESRLSAALFSDAAEYELDTKSSRMSLHSLRRRRTKKAATGTQPWAVGLAPALLEDEKWPPEGTDLGFSLRTVIVDSIGRRADKNTDESDKVNEEAEYRLGFAIRDLPAGSGKEKWLNPLSIEALDFLYMSYKPPRALEILITPEILSKYQRMFAFILRLMRVTYAIKAVYRLSRYSSKPLFETLVNFRKLMLHFRFVADLFISNLSAYVFDTAIGGNFDPFVQRLAATAIAASSPSGMSSRTVSPTSTHALHLHPETERFNDVFSLSQSHSELLDNILCACLLRSGQREVGDILRQALELVLDFSVVIGELHRGRLKEYEAGPMVETLFSKFRSKMAVFTRVLKELAEKTGGNASTRIIGEEIQEGRRRATGGMEALSHLMIKLDTGDWWTRV